MRTINIAIVAIAVVVLAVVLRPTGHPAVTDYYFTDNDGRIVTYTTPSWVDGNAISHSYEGSGIYSVKFDSGWNVKVNRLGVVWQAIHEPTPAPRIPFSIVNGIVSVAALLSGIGLIARLIRRRSQRKLDEQLQSILNEKKNDELWSSIREAQAKMAKEMGSTVDVEQGPDGVWRPQQ